MRFVGKEINRIPEPISNLLSTLRQWVENMSPGGYWYYGGYAGLWYLNLVSDRSFSNAYTGFRPEELMELVRNAEEAPALRVRVAELETALDEIDGNPKTK